MENKPDGQSAKGFSGLESMLSDVDETIASVPEAKAPEPDKRDPKLVVHEHGEPLGRSAQVPPSSIPQGGKWLIGIVVVGILLAIIGTNGKHLDAPIIEKTAEAPAPEPAPAMEMPPWEQVNTSPPPVAPVVPDIERAPVGTDLVLSPAQIRYCFTEDIKDAAIKQVVNLYSSEEVDDFNALVADYNTRCGSFRYRKGTLEGIRADVESRRAVIEHEAKRQWVRQHVGVKDAKPEPKAAHKASIPEHSHIDVLGHDWECNRGYHLDGNECVKLVLPAHAHVDVLGHDWECDRGYRPDGIECMKVALPVNAHIDVLGHDWECNRGYTQVDNKCVAVGTY